MEDINRIKLVLVEKKRTSKWLSEQLGVTPSTVSKWCTNSSQPDITNLLKIASLLDVDIKESKSCWSVSIRRTTYCHKRINFRFHKACENITDKRNRFLL